MDKEEYLRIEKAARKSKISLYVNVVYVVLFILLAGYVLSYVAPQFYYVKLDSDRRDVETHPVEGDPSMKEGSYSEREVYRQFWFDVTQNNKRYQSFGGTTTQRPFGKDETYLVTKQVGGQTYQLAEVNNHFFFGDIQTIEVKSYQEQDNYYFPYQTSESTSFDRLLEMLQEKGKANVATIQVAFSQVKSRDEVDKLVPQGGNELSRDDQVELLRYGVANPTAPVSFSSFGYPARRLNDQSSQSVSEDDFLQQLTYLAKHYPQHGHLLLDNPRNYKRPTYDEFQKKYEEGLMPYDVFQDYLTPFDRVWQAFPQKNDVTYFEDMQDYIKFNGVKYSSITLTGSCNQLVMWLTANRQVIRAFKLDDIEDWNYSQIGGDF